MMIHSLRPVGFRLAFMLFRKITSKLLNAYFLTLESGANAFKLFLPDENRVCLRLRVKLKSQNRRIGTRDQPTS